MKNKKIIFMISLLILSLLFLGCESKVENANKVYKVEVKKENYDPDCVEFVALWPAGDIAKKIGKDKKWVFLNYRVDIWDTPPSEQKGSVVSKLRASSYARIIEKRDEDYKVESPIDKTVGWLSKEHVKTISWKNPKTKKLCK